MSSLRTVHILLWLSFYHVRSVVSGPMEVSNRYQRASSVEQNDWRLVLSSIESRLKSLDFLYTSQLTPTLESRLEHFQNRISGMEVKLLRVEALLTSKLDRMSDNISSRHFRDDMVQTDIFRKMETAYDGITHRLAYMDRKSDSSFVKLQEKYEAFSKKIDGITNALTDKYDSIESQLTDLVDGMDDISASFNAGMKPNNKHASPRNGTQASQQDLKDSSTKILNEIKDSCINSSTISKKVEGKLQDFTGPNSVESLITNSTDYLENILNEYASKVSDLGAQVTKSDHKIAAHLSVIEKVVNSSRAETQNALRALMVQVGSISPKDNSQYQVIDENILSDMSQKLDSNFEKVISTQNTFLESCHRLQMDESQLEGEISDILNKLIDNFEGTTREHHHVLRKIEGLLVKHDLHTKKEMHQANVNIISAYEQSKKESKEIRDQYKQITNNLEALLALSQNLLGSGNTVNKRGISQTKEVIEYVQSLERALNFTKEQQLRMFDSYKVTVETLLTLSQTKQEDEHSAVNMMKNLTLNMSKLRKNIESLPEKLNANITDILKSVGKTYELLMKNSNKLSELSNYTYSRSNKIFNSEETVNETNSNNYKDIDSLIKEIFYNNETQLLNSSTTTVACLDFDIDIRADIAENGSYQRPLRKCQNVSASGSDEKISFPSEENVTDEIDCLEIPIDPRFDQGENNNQSKKLCSSSKDKQIEHQHFEEQHTEKNSSTADQLMQKIIPFIEIKNKASYEDIDEH